MPTFKHPCPYCGKFIDKIAAACPYCGVKEPFAPKRCANCRNIVEDGWIACPSCGASLLPPPPVGPNQPQAPSPIADANAAAHPTTSATTGQPDAAPSSPAPPPVDTAPAQVHGTLTPPGGIAATVAPPPAGRCAGCGAPLSAGARFCTACGTLAG